MRMLLVLCAGLGLAFCGQGAGLWSSDSEVASPTEPAAASKPVPQQLNDATRSNDAQASPSTQSNAESEAARAAIEADRQGAIAALDESRRARVEALVAALQRGAYHAALSAVVELDPANDEAAATALRATAQANGWPDLMGSVRDPLPWIPSEFSLKGRLVRTAADAAACRVVEHARNDATLRVLTPQGVTFPKYLAHALEPDAVRSEDAVELGLLAYGAADYSSARIWCAIAIARGSGASDRMAQLRNCLR